MELDKTVRFTAAPITVSDLARLVIFDGDGEARCVDLLDFRKSVVTLGRSEDCDIVLKSRLVSRLHCTFRISGSRVTVLDDPDSANGLLFQGRKIRELELQDGDELRIDRAIREDPDGSGADREQNGVLLLFSRSEDCDQWKRFPLAGSGPVTIGRGEACSLRLPYPSVSSHHATVEQSGGKWYISDNGSTNGVSVNGRMIRSRTLLREKDIIHITGTKLVFSHFGLYYHTSTGGISVEAQDVVKQVGRKKLTICDHASLFIKGGDLVAIIGGSGAGKSTIMNCLCGYSKPTAGSVKINGEDLYSNLGVFRNIIGYVPQADIVFDNLSVEQMLRYAAKLRLPEDTTPQEQAQRIREVLEIVELQGKEDTPIKRLSGGQKKRVSIAVELLPDPNLLFLDEPTSGLDPGTERSLMRTLQTMARNGKTIILVTHSTLQLQLCDKIVFMGRGGRLCYCGNYASALEYFSVDNIVDIYQTLTKDSAMWKSRYDQMRQGPKSSGSGDDAGRFDQKRKSTFQQLKVLAARNLKLLGNDVNRMLLLLLQAPLLSLLIYLVSDGKQFEQYEMTKSILFALACSGFWLGTLNSIQEVCKERVILKREYMTGLHVSGYLLSKLLVLGLVCLVQSLLLITVFAVLVGMPESGMMITPFIEMFFTTFLTSLSATAMGLFVSSLFKNADRAMAVAPLLLMPQILFSGLVFDLDGATEIISWFAACRWAMEGYGTTADLNGLPLRLQQEGIPIAHEAEDFFTHTVGHMLGVWAVLILFVVGFTLLSQLALTNLKKEN